MTDWPTITVDALDMDRAARRLFDELGVDRCDDLRRALGYLVAQADDRASLVTRMPRGFRKR